MMRSARVVFLLVALAVPAQLLAQVSVYAVHGIGFPGRPLSARSRALGGGSALFDPASAINPAAPIGFRRPTAMAISGTELRTYEVAGVAADGLRNTRFPLILVGGRVSRRMAFAASLATYAERTFDITASDTVILRGTPVGVSDRIVSDGGIADIRGALAWAVSARLSVGVSVHALSGSTKLQVRRTFEDSSFRSFRQEGRSSFWGLGAAAGFLWSALPGLDLGGAVRFDGGLDVTLDSVKVGEFNLPTTITGGVRLTPVPALRLTVTGQWRSWSDAAADVAAAGTTAFDTWEIGTGLELGGAATGTSRIPLRLGFRYAQLPFAPDARRPRELDFSAGTGVAFANSRGLLDVVVERVLRDGTDVRERVWQISVGMTVRP